MPEKILVAMDESDNAMRAAEYVGRIVGQQLDFDILVLYVLVRPKPDLFETPEAASRYVAEKKAKVQEVFEQAKAVLRKCCVSRECVQTKLLLTDQPGVALAIMAEQARGGYGTIVLGRRGVTKAEEFLFGSVTNKIVHHAKDCAVWVVQ